MDASSGDSARPIGELDGHSLLAEFERSGVFAGGRAHLISLKSVREALAGRWATRKALVWAMTEAQIRRRIGDRAYMTRLNEDLFLILTPELDPAAGRVLAVRILHEVVSYFLGDRPIGSIEVMIAGAFDGGRLNCRPFSAEELSSALTTFKAERGGSEGHDAKSVHEPSPSDEGRLTTLGGRRLRYSVRVDPVIDLNRFAITGHRIEPNISFEDTRQSLSPAERRRLLPRDVQDVDLATLRRGLSRLRSGQSNSERPSLIISISYLSLSNTSARARLIAEAATAHEAMVRSVIFEITDFDRGVPSGPLMDGVARLKPFCRSVFAAAEGSSELVQTSKTLGFAGLVFQPPHALTTADGEAVWLLAMNRTFEACTGTRIAANLTTTTLLPLASAAGLTHATVRA